MQHLQLYFQSMRRWQNYYDGLHSADDAHAPTCSINHHGACYSVFCMCMPEFDSPCCLDRPARLFLITCCCSFKCKQADSLLFSFSPPQICMCYRQRSTTKLFTPLGHKQTSKGKRDLRGRFQENQTTETFASNSDETIHPRSQTFYYAWRKKKKTYSTSNDPLNNFLPKIILWGQYGNPWLLIKS